MCDQAQTVYMTLYSLDKCLQTIRGGMCSREVHGNYLLRGRAEVELLTNLLYIESTHTMSYI